MRIPNNLIRVAVLVSLASVGLLASDRFGYTINLPKQKISIIITCKDIDKNIIQDPGFKGLVKPIGEVIAGSIDEFSENRTYLVFIRLSGGKVYCHVDEEPIGDHPVIKEFSFSTKQWKSRFVEKVFRGILGRTKLTKKSVELHKRVENSEASNVRIELGPVPGQPLESWSVSWR